MSEYYIGLMSGTSIDAIDAVVAQISEHKIDIVATHNHEIPPTIKKAIFDLCQSGENEIDRMGALDYQLGQLFAEATKALLHRFAINRDEIKAIGSHGQTIRHRPDNEFPFSLQIGNPALICQLCGITTVADFRRADIAAGGQGAPLVPAFHRALFTHDQHDRVIVNIGGMSNISILPSKHHSTPNKTAGGFDTGPGNVLLNAWINEKQQRPYDDKGTWSSTFLYDEDLLEILIAHPYFKKEPPKSTGRETFHLSWLQKTLKKFNRDIASGVVQSTLCELTAQSISQAILKFAPNTSEILVCGGGAHNNDLIARIVNKCQMTVTPTDAFGISVDYVEAVAFAWLAKQALDRKPANLPNVTGAKHPVILGAIYAR